MEKECFKCKVIKPLTEFYKHPQMHDGHVNKCKECNKIDVKGNYFLNIKNESFIISERKRGRQKYHRLYSGTGKSNQIANKKWKEKFPEKKEALLKSQYLKNVGFQKHHWSYNETDYKSVIWLTIKEHSKAHRFIIYDQERKMYRRFDNNILLDNIDAHRNFIMNCILNLED